MADVSDITTTVQHQQAFETFDDFLTLRQRDVTGEDGIDIREKMLALRMAPWAIGYAGFNIDRAYGANLRLLWPDLTSFDAPEAAAAQHHHLLMGTIYADPAHSNIGGVALMQQYQPEDELILGEQGFLASTHSWSEAFRQKDPCLGCLGYVYDDISYYFMADYPNRLIHRLNGDQEVDQAETARARGLIDRIVRNKISKYNSQPIATPAMTRGYTRRVLVCDQTFADASTVFGRIDEAGFEAMLLAALAENPDAEILIKTHPDTAWEKDKRTGYYTHLVDTGRVRILRAPLNPYLLFEQVDKVYVGTSQIGLEALFAGKEVVCFGAPFYAGWGLTDDRQDIPHRDRCRTLEDIFYYFYVWYTIYHVPGAAQVPSEIEEVLDYIEQHRPVALPKARYKASKHPKISVIIPVYEVERYIEECLRSVQDQTLDEIEIITINDRSPDQSQAIIDQLAASDPRIRSIVLEQNVGQGFARNIGLDQARGDYVLFIDSDDYMASPGYLQHVYDTALSDKADMVRGRKLFEQIEDASGTVLRMKHDRCEIHFDQPFHAVTLEEEPRILQNRHFWTWLYRRKFLETHNIRFLTAQWEERPFMLRALLSAARISGTTSEGFIYRVRHDSTARRPKFERDSFNQLANFEQIVAILEEFDAFAPRSPLAYTAGFMVMQALHILFTGFAYSTVRGAGKRMIAERFLDRVTAVLERTGLGFDAMVFDAPQISKERIGTQSYRLLFEALRQRRFDYVDIAVDETAVDQKTVMDCLLQVPADADEAAFQTALSLYARNERVRTATGLSPVTDKPRLVIHVGQTKTGSTYIQHFLEQNRPALLRAGIWVPDMGLVWQKTRPHKQAGHGDMTREAVTGGHVIRDHIEAALNLAEGRIHTVILSSEAYFLNHRAARIPDHFPDYPVEMIGYFRRQDDWANSQYAEFVAGGAMGRVSVPFEEWIDDPVTRERLDYFSYCQLWAARIGRENVHARVYDRAALKNGDVVSDFLSALELEAMDTLPRPDQSHANDMPFNTAHILMLREINAYDWPNGADYLDFIQDVTDRIAALRGADAFEPGRVGVIRPVARQRLLAALAASNAAFGRVFCEGAATAFAPSSPENEGGEAGAEVVLSTSEIAAVYDALRDYDAGGRSLLGVADAQRRTAARPLKPIPETVEELREYDTGGKVPLVVADAQRRAAARPPKPIPETVEEMKMLGGILLDIQGLPQKVSCGEVFEAEITLFNLSEYRMPRGFFGRQVVLSYHIHDAEMKKVVWNGLRTPLTEPVDYWYRGALRIEAPPNPGVYRLQAGTVVEGQRWFDSHQTWLFEAR